jgi:hypothetical protein
LSGGGAPPPRPATPPYSRRRTDEEATTMMTHGGQGARGVTETDSDTESYRKLVLAQRGTGVVQAARLTSAVHKTAPATLGTSNRGLNTKERYLPHV